ncbi:MAG: hypothetical protein KJ062_18680, partial [Thermoanaerobaculia bacterium]|nr:hypothetical protein [Thermoanaerobaculia bacterium]
MAVPALAGQASPPPAAARSDWPPTAVVLALALLLAGPGTVTAQQPEPAPTPPPATLDLRPGGLPQPPASPLAGALPAATTLQASPAGAIEPIVDIAVRGGRTVTAETVGFYLGVKVGDPYDAAQLRRSFAKLWDSGLFEDL